MHRTLLHLAVLDAAPPRESDKALAVLPPAPAVQGDASNRFRSLLEPEPAAARSCWAVGVANDEAFKTLSTDGRIRKLIALIDEYRDEAEKDFGSQGELFALEEALAAAARKGGTPVVFVGLFTRPETDSFSWRERMRAAAVQGRNFG